MGNYKEYFTRLDRAGSTSNQTIEKAEKALGFALPEDYKSFVREMNGATGFVGENSYISFYPIEDLIKRNESYAIQEFLPGCLLFASDGGGEAYLYDVTNEKKRIINIPFIPMDMEYATICSDTFEGFLQYLHDIE